MSDAIEIHSPNGTKIKAWIKGVELEDTAKAQLLNVASLDFIYPHIAVMPDVHWGMGCTIGSVIPTIGAIIPAAVGVDIGCGMMAAKTNLMAKDLPDNLYELRTAIEVAVPHGRTNNGKKGDRGAWGEIAVRDDIIMSILKEDLNIIVEKHPLIKDAAQRMPYHLGTLGTGNHFIEICLDEEQYVWVMLHSGSRGIGNRIGTYFIELAKEEMIKNGIYVVDKDLSYLKEGTKFFDDYCEAVEWAQNFAKSNRSIMMSNCLSSMFKVIDPERIYITDFAINCHHNYVKKEHHFGKDVWLTRKGAINAEKDVLGIIPGSMGAKSYIVKGKGNPESFHSCSHGAGRRMGRNEAKKKFTLEDHIKMTQGVECRKDIDVIDETPAAYKDIDAVMAAQTELVEIVATLKQVVCVKG